MNELRNIDTSFESYAQLVTLHHEHKDDFFETIEVTLKQWFGANMAAPLGAVLDKLSSPLNTIKLTEMDSDIQSILQKNHFLSHFGFANQADTYSTTIPYQKLKPSDGRFFMDYVQKGLLARTELPHMSDGLKRKMAESIFEIFVNAQMHSESEHIYTCGQFFPKKEKIEFCITDAGIGFKEKMIRRFGQSVSSLDAIRWAVEDKHTTKQDVSGGLGLALLKEFIMKNKGKLQIVSDLGFYELSTDHEEAKQLPHRFPGAIINVQFLTNDKTNYYLSSERNSTL